ncbi:MAG: hypothetical protein HY216_03365, partial [Candidatus Rokubacteria bacterium]|nr:hypothetical protein [Candidatus Rokubacteria bacterium]
RHLDHAWFYLSLGALEAADRQLLAIDNLADDAEALNLRGTLLAIGGQTDLALEHLGRACALAPAAPLPRVNRATVAMLAERDEAERFCGEALGVLDAADPATAPAAAFEGPVYPIGYDRFGAELAQAYVNVPPGAPRHAALARLYRYRLHHAMGRLRMGRQAWAGALADLDAAVAALPDDGYVRYDRALAARAVGRSDTVLPDLADAVRLEPFFFQAQQDLALALEAAGRRDEAVAHLWDLVTHNPIVAIEADVLVKAAELALAVGDRAKAVPLFARAAAQKPDDAALAARLADVRDTRATVVVVVDRDVRVAQRMIHTLCEETPATAADLVVIVPPEARTLPAFLRVLDRAITVVPGTNDFATDVGTAAANATGSHIVILDGALVVEPNWLPPLLAATDDHTVTLPTVKGDETARKSVRASFCATRQLWNAVGGLAVGDDPRALKSLGERLVAAGVKVRHVAESVAVVIETTTGAEGRAALGASSANPSPADVNAAPPARLGTPPTTAAPTTVVVSEDAPSAACPSAPALSRGLRHVPAPPAE